MRNSWARAFLETLADFVGEDTTMTDPMFYPNAWRRARELDEETARINAALALANAADEQRKSEALQDEYYEHNPLAANGICEVCHFSESQCICEDKADARIP